jgi:hypothetical protein
MADPTRARPIMSQIELKKNRGYPVLLEKNAKNSRVHGHKFNTSFR